MSGCLEEQLNKLAALGCYPSIYRRGEGWRVHINAAGNFWADDPSITGALHKAFRSWDERGRPMDGMAADKAKNRRTEAGEAA